MDAAQVDEIGDGSAGRELLRARDDDAVVALLHHPGIERRVALLVRGLAAVDLGRNDRVGDVEVMVAHVLVEGDHVVRELLSACRQHVGSCRIAGEEARHVIGRPSHQAEGRLRPGLREQAPRLEVGMAPRDLVGAQHRLAGLGRDEGHALAQLRLGRDVVEPRHRARRLAKCTVFGYVLDALAVDEHLPSVVERAKIVRSGPHAACIEVRRLGRAHQGVYARLRG